MKVAIFAGGSGSANLQKAAKLQYGDDLDIHIITNLYDNGMSTGDVRKVFDGKISGPSDLRKNQLRAAKLKYNYVSNSNILDLIDILEERASGSMEDYRDNLLRRLEPYANILWMAVDYFFTQEKAKYIKYEDFSNANIVYAGLAAMNGNSMIKAGEIMAEILDIPIDRVLPVNDDPSFLTATTENGTFISDEADIVDWNNPTDRINSINCDTNNWPINPRVENVIKEADVIIHSSGTFFSSLLPTYANREIIDLLANSDAQQYCIVNSVTDKDMTGYSADDFAEFIKDSVYNDKIIFVQNINQENKIKNLDKHFVIEHDKLSDIQTIIHNYISDKIGLDNKTYVFDYDGTLDDYFNLFTEVTKYSRNFIICSGNGGKHIPKYRGRTFYNRGASGRSGDLEPYHLEEFIIPSKEISSIIKNLVSMGIPQSDIEVRDNIIIAIKPVPNAYREIIANFLEIRYEEYKIITAGKTTIEISKHGLDKSVMMHQLKNSDYVYFGDEPDGNDMYFKYHAPKFVDCSRNNKIVGIFLRVLQDWKI